MKDTVKEVYHSVRTAPNKLKNYVQKKLIRQWTVFFIKSQASLIRESHLLRKKKYHSIANG